jgi:uncharacterized protein
LKRRRKRIKKTPGRLWVVPLVALAAVGISVYFIFHLHKRPPHTVASRLSPSPPRSVSIQRLLRAVERSGGKGVWIKSFSTKSFKAHLTVVAVPPVYSGVVKAAVDVARREKLALHCRPADACRLANPSRRSSPDALPVFPSRPERASEKYNSPFSRSVKIAAEFHRRRLWTLGLIEVPRITRVAIVIDDLGQSLEAARKFATMPAALTLSIMPRLPYSRFTAEEGTREGHEVMLHLPMQPLDDRARDVSPNELQVGMSKSRIDGIIQADLASVPGVRGVNNHMGSRATSNTRLMQEVMANLAARHLYFVDSVTTPDSVALAEARQFGVPSFYRSVFLDDTRTVPYTLSQLLRLCRLAKQRGAALAIGHPYPTTIKALVRFVPEFSRKDIQIVPASWLVERTNVARN